MEHISCRQMCSKVQPQTDKDHDQADHHDQADQAAQVDHQEEGASNINIGPL